MAFFRKINQSNYQCSKSVDLSHGIPCYPAARHGTFWGNFSKEYSMGFSNVLGVRDSLVLTYWPFRPVSSWCTSANLLALRCFMYSKFFGKGDKNFEYIKQRRASFKAPFKGPFPLKILSVFLNYNRFYLFNFFACFFNMRDPAGFSGYRGIWMHFHEISRDPAVSHGKARDWKKLSRAGAGCNGIENRSRFRTLQCLNYAWKLSDVFSNVFSKYYRNDLG